MLYDYIVENFEYGEPIFLEELPCKSKDYLRQEVKNLADKGALERLYNGVYYLPYTTILGTKGKVSFDKYMEKRYLLSDGRVNGYITGLQLANAYGFTSQNPACYEVCSNEATTKQRKLEICGRNVIVYKPVTTVTEDNKAALQFLDLMSVIDKYSEISGKEMQVKLKSFTDSLSLLFESVKEYISLYPDKVYRNIYEGGLMGELV
ncbi:MAG: hypothetical protein LUH07_12575 [Lachnospiraceae bacterium]|nr:hypothetical protein [Lachnospiraceae bacterium]